MNKTFNFLILVAVLMGGFAAFLAVRILQSAKGTASVEVANAPVAVETVKLGFAVTEIKPGQPILDTMVEFKDFPKDMVPETGVTAMEQLTGLVAGMVIPPGDMLLTQKVKPPEQLLRASLTIPKGKRFVTVGVNDETANAFLIKNGDFVDIVYSTRLESFGRDPEGRPKDVMFTKVLLQGVQVYDIQYGEEIGESTGEEPEGSGAVRRGRGATATFLVTPVEAEAIINASKNGEISLVLRRFDDFEDVKTAGMQENTLSEMMGLDAAPKAPEAPVVQEAPKEAPRRPFY